MRLSREQIDYLIDIGLLSSSCTNPNNDVDRICDALIVRLAKFGFDENYNLNKEGAIIQRIIDDPGQ